MIKIKHLFTNVYAALYLTKLSSSAFLPNPLINTQRKFKNKCFGNYNTENLTREM